MTDPFVTLGRAKLMATGVRLDARPPSLTPSSDSEGEFNVVVSGYYKFFREEIALDVSLLRKVSNGPYVVAFDRLVNNLRTVAQHTGNPDAVRRVEIFKREHPTWPERSRALGEHLEAALTELAAIAVSVSRDAAESAKWKAAATLDVASVFDAVLTDLALDLPAWRRVHMQRQVKARIRHDVPTSEYVRTVQDYCVQEIASEKHVLPVPYYEVLDYLGLLGSRQAESAVLIAYSVASAAPNLSDSVFLVRVSETWKAAISA